MNKYINIPNVTLYKKVKIISLIFDLTASERLLICKLIDYSINNTIALTIDISAKIRGDITATSFNTGIFRLEKTGAIKKSGKTIMLHPIFNNISELDRFTFVFQSPQVFKEDANS
jgi:hypothetical protein